ncbi:MAG: choice-of-anchor I family protein [Planctomycetes bacterium]|nr:choice-of-anchor I family protein [Planctomycetota bacterium]
MPIRSAAVALAATAALTAQSSHTHLSSIQSTNLASEIVAYDASSNRFFVTNASGNRLDVYGATATGSLYPVQTIALSGQPNSVAARNGLVAVAVEGATGQAPGAVQFFDAATGAANGVAATVGAMPDMLTFTPDGLKVLTANEGEADLATGLVNPEGSVSIVDVVTRNVATASFQPWNGQKAALQAQGVRISNVNGITLAQDLEPEYLTIDPTSTTAWVTLQEANAIAEVDIASATVTAIRPLGWKNHALPGNELDASDQDGVNGNFLNFPILGLYMPDAITSFTVAGVTYLVTANEGDSRADFAGFVDQMRGASVDNNFALDCEDPTPETGLYTLAQLNTNAVLGRLNFATSDYDVARGDTDNDGDVDQLYVFGGRSFSIWTTSGALVFDSGDDIEREMLARGLWVDSRSDDKGPEPEAVAFGVVDGVPTLFVGLERTNSVMVYDVSNPAAPVLRDVIRVAAESGVNATAPEGVQFIPAVGNATGRPLMAVASEGNGTLSLFAIDTGDASVVTFGTGCPAVQPLTLASNLPQLAGTWTLSATNVNLAAPFCTFWFSASALVAPIELTVVNATGCFAYIDGGIGAFLSPAAGGASSFQVVVPANPALLAYSLAAQATTFDGSTFASSNGLVGVVGL